MSQFVKVNCQVLDDVNAAVFKKMIESMKLEGKKENNRYSLDINAKKVTGSYIRENDDTDVDCVLMENNKRLPIGFKFIKEGNKLKLNIRGDFWGTGFEENSFKDLISKNYQIANIMLKNKNNGNTLVSRTVKEDGSVVLRYCA